MKNSDSLRDGEPHPASITARHYIAQLGFQKCVMYLESFASCAIEGNRLSEICLGTLERLMNGRPVSDRYVLGLAWTIQEIERVATKNNKEEPEHDKS